MKKKQMTREMIDFGIFLGVDNSCIAMFNNGNVEVIKNNEGCEYTPSVVWLAENNVLWVGRVAEEHLEVDAANSSRDFMRLIGSSEKINFYRTEQSFFPEELAAEILKELKANVRQRFGEEITEAVITIPSSYTLSACEATRRAAQLAGITHCILLYEPVAAALAYGNLLRNQSEFWIVCNFRYGTFEATILQLRDGIIKVVSHGENFFRGEKNIDWAIVEELLAPAIRNNAILPDFRRENIKWRSAFSKLKHQAEVAKNALSYRKSFDISIVFTKEDGFDDLFILDYELQQTDVELIVESSIENAIHICRDVMAQIRISSENIKKMILVGDEYFIRFFCEKISDPTNGLGIPFEYGIDPRKVIAQGVAMFAGTQKFSSLQKFILEKDTYLSNSSLPLKCDLEKEKSKLLLRHSIGFGLQNNEYLVILDQQSPLPSRLRKIFKTQKDFYVGQKENPFELELYEGENPLADHNLLLSKIKINANQIKRNLPIGSEVEVEVIIDQFHTIWVKVYVPLLDEEFEMNLKMTF